VKVSFTTEEGAGGGRERGPGKETRKDGRQEGSERKGEKRRGRPEQLEDRRQKAPPAVLLASLLPVSSVWCHALIWTQTWAVSWANAHTSFSLLQLFGSCDVHNHIPSRVSVFLHTLLFNSPSGLLHSQVHLPSSEISDASKTS